MFNIKLKCISKLITIFTVLTVFISCGPIPLSRLGLESDKQISVSVHNHSVSRNLSSDSRSLSRYSIQEMTDDTYFKTDRKDANRGVLLNSFTPEEFILDLDSISLYSGNEKADLTPFRSTPEGYIIPRHVNIVYANDFIRDFLITSPKWDGLYMQFLPGIGGTSPMNMQVMSIVGIDLGADYNSVSLTNEITGTLGMYFTVVPGRHYFEFSSLQPYNVDFLSYLIIGSDIDTTGIQNPTSAMPPSDPGYWELPGGSTSGNASMIFIPGKEIDFPSFSNPKVIFNWDLTNIVQVYEGPTTAKNDDIVTFNLTTPFPVSITVEENSDQSSNSGNNDTTAPEEVTLYAIYGTSSYNVLIWINPTDTDFEKIVIVRKNGSEPTSKDDGGVVYEGYEPNFCDTTTTPGSHYFYKIFTVDYAGNYSAGAALDRIVQ